MNSKVIVAGLVLMVSLASVVSFGVTESWFSDSEQSEIEITLAPLKIEYSEDGSDWTIWNLSDNSPEATGGMMVRSNYAISLHIENDCLSLSGSTTPMVLDAGIQYELSKVESGWTCTEVNP